MVLEWSPLSLPHRLRVQQPNLFGANEVQLVLCRADDLGLATEVTTGKVPEREVEPIPGSESIGDTLQVVAQPHRAATLRAYRSRSHHMTTASGEARTRVFGTAESLDVEFKPAIQPQ